MTATKSTERPAKPYPEFPLYAHPRGYWCKTYQGRKYNCGKWYDDKGRSNHKAALEQWKDIRNKLENGEDPRPATGATNVDVMVNAFLDSKNLQVECGDLTLATFNQYKIVAAWLKANLGAYRLIDSIGPNDFAKLRSKFDASWSLTTVSNQIVLIRTIFKWAFENELLDRPVKYGTNFSKPKAKRRRDEKAGKPKKLFTAKEIWAMHDYANKQVRAWILLGLNAAYGNSDLSRLKVSDVSGAWLTVPRGKTGEERKAWLWPITRKAIKAVLEDHDGGELLFTTRYGQPLVEDSGFRDAVAGEFAKVKEDCGCDRKGVGFYALRHCFATQANETKDQPAIDLVMGHVDSSMPANYRQEISDARVKKVCQHVEAWFMAAKPKRRRAAK